MPGNPRDLITTVERRLPVRIRLVLRPKGLGHRYAQMTAWLDENCGSGGWAMALSRMEACRRMPCRLISRRRARDRVHRPVVCRVQGGDQWQGPPAAGR